MDSVFSTVLALNFLWFGAAFWYFGIVPDSSAKILVPKSARDSPLFATVSASVRFLGGMNFAFAVFAALLLAYGSLFPEPGQRALFAAVFALAHAGQFAFNLPVALRGGRQGESLWPVFAGPMLLIFIVDFTLMLSNAALSAFLLCAEGA
ncbi:MAG: hypothetical protein Q8R92_00605 [Deltaproteobacteria bacterium]|nr:hypothetical protein [Deltaproteobacteria bacterium]